MSKVKYTTDKTGGGWLTDIKIDNAIHVDGEPGSDNYTAPIFEVNESGEAVVSDATVIPEEGIAGDFVLKVYAYRGGTLQGSALTSVPVVRSSGMLTFREYFCDVSSATPGSDGYEVLNEIHIPVRLIAGGDTMPVYFLSKSLTSIVDATKEIPEVPLAVNVENVGSDLWRVSATWTARDAVLIGGIILYAD